MSPQNLLSLCRTGYFYCLTCDAISEPVVSDHLQCTKCHKCGSVHIFWNPPFLSTHDTDPTPDRKAVDLS